jgi:hypothetical protein
LKSEKGQINNFKISEDCYFGLCDSEKFSVAPEDIALKFSFEREVRECYRLNKNSLPFGCHAWMKHDLKFWKPYIESNGFHVSDEWIMNGQMDELNPKEYAAKKVYAKFWKNEYRPEMLRRSIDNAFGNMQKQIAIFGAGYWGNNLCAMLIDAGYQVEKFIDNNPNVRHQKMQGVEVIGLDELEIGKFNVIIAIDGETASVCEQLSQKGYVYKRDYILIQDIGFIKDNSIL